MAIPKEVFDALMKDYKGPEDITGPNGLLKELTKALVERAMQDEMTDQIGYARNDQSEKQPRIGETVKPKRRCAQIRALSKLRSDPYCQSWTMSSYADFLIV